MKSFYFVVTIQENEKYYSYVIKAMSNDNLLSKFKIKNVVAVDIHPTKKDAFRVATDRNAIYKINNNYLFDETF